MALNEHKVKDTDFSAKDIATLNDRPNAEGMSAQALKERFDAGAKKVLAPKLNALIDELVSQNGASGIGVTPIEGLSGYDVQNVLLAVKMLLDTKKPTEQADIEIGRKFDTSEAQTLVKSVEFNATTGVFTITKYNGAVETIDTAIEKVALDVRLDGQQFVLTLADGTEQRVDLSAFVTETEVQSSDTVTLTIENGVITARLAYSSVTLAHLAPEIKAYFDEKTQSAVTSAAEAKVSEQNALLSANAAEQAKQIAVASQESATASEAIAVTSAADAKRYAEEAKNYVGAANINVNGKRPSEDGTLTLVATDVGFSYGKEDLVDGESPLPAGHVYLKI